MSSTIHNDQATHLRSLAESTSAHTERTSTASNRRAAAPVLAIASGKGGVGKSVVCVNVATCFAQAGTETLLIDGDVGMGSVDVMLGVNAKHHMGHVLHAGVGLDRALIRVSDHLRIVPGGSGPWDQQQASRGAYAAAVEHARDLAELVLIDCGAGIADEVMTWLSLADRTVVVTTPEPTAVSDAYALIKCIVRRRIPTLPSLVVNAVRNQQEADAVAGRIAHVSSSFLGAGIECSGAVRGDGAITRSIRDRQPAVLFAPKSRAANDLHALSQALALQLLTHEPHMTLPVAQRVRRLLRR